ncbi:MAG: hypothetical protein PHG97_05385 [Candidatus Margulisbacteria bacterium]|nr:hypothetical protein [Candidatus Margulisiibacteriota bacterium]
MNVLHLGSLLLEAGVALLGIALGAVQKKAYGWFIALTFAVYVFYDLARFMSIGVSADLLDSLFLIASLSIFWAVANIYFGKK